MTKAIRKKLFVVMRGNNLVMDLTHAKTPGIITLDTAKLPVAYFQTSNGADGTTLLGYSNESGSFTTLATFSSAEDANAMRDQIVHAFMDRGRTLNKLRRVLIIIASIFVGLWLVNQLLLAVAPAPTPMDAAMEQMNVPDDAPAVPGAPVDADAFLKKGG